MGRVSAALAAVGRWAGFALFLLQLKDGQGLCCSDYRGKMARVIAFLSAGGRWAWFVLSDYIGEMCLCCSCCSGESGQGF